MGWHIAQTNRGLGLWAFHHYQLLHSSLSQIEVGTMSLCHGVMPMTMDDTFALVSASFLHDPTKEIFVFG